MTCAEVLDRLGDVVDGGALPETAVEIARHLAGCAACRDEDQAIRSLKAAAAALPPEIAPGRDLWAAIEPSLAGGRSTPAPVPVPRARPGWFRPAVAAAALAAILAGAGWLAMVMRRSAPEPSTEIASVPAALPPSGAAPGRPDEGHATVPASIPAAGASGLASAELSFQEAKQEMRNALYERRKSLSPETLKKVDQDLKIIEDAIVEIRTAVDRDPGNRELQKMLVATRQREVALLRHVTQSADLRSR